MTCQFIFGAHKVCGKPWAYQDVTGAWCFEHWMRAEVGPLWYANGMAYGWDASRPDPTVGL